MRMGDPPSEIHIVNGLHPGLPFAYYEELLAGFKRIKPDVSHEVLHGGGDPLLRAALRDDPRGGARAALRAAGLESLPGGGAEIFHPDVRTRISHDKATAEEYLEVHRVAHRARPARRTRRCSTGTSRRSSTGWTTCCACARSRTRPGAGLLQAFIPLAFHPDGNGMKNLPAPTGVDDLRTLAVSRLLLDNVPHIKAYWVSMTPEVAQVGAALRRRRPRRHDRPRDHLQRRGLRLRRRGSRTRSSCASSARPGARPSSATRSTTSSASTRARRVPEAAFKVQGSQGRTHLVVLVSAPAREPGSAPFRVAAVGYLNARPLYEPLDRATRASTARRSALPREVARRVAEDEVGRRRSCRSRRPRPSATCASCAAWPSARAARVRSVVLVSRAADRGASRSSRSTSRRAPASPSSRVLLRAPARRSRAALRRHAAGSRGVASVSAGHARRARHRRPGAHWSREVSPRRRPRRARGGAGPGSRSSSPRGAGGEGRCRRTKSRLLRGAKADGLARRDAIADAHARETGLAAASMRDYLDERDPLRARRGRARGARSASTTRPRSTGSCRRTTRPVLRRGPRARPRRAHPSIDACSRARPTASG